MIRKKGEGRSEQRKIHNGDGEINLIHMFNREDMFDKARLCAELTIAPGCSIGDHAHVDDMELFYLLEGELVSINPDGSEERFCAGDVMLTGGGERHCLRNDTNTVTRMFAVIAS